MTHLKNIGNKFGFTEIELKVILFLTASFLIGSFAYFLKYKSEIIELEKYDYRKQDSLFWNSNNQSEIKLADKKRVDYERELLDFSNNNFEHKININNSTVEELTLLPGIGEKTAEKIINYRIKKGGFQALNDLLNVPGIGSKKLEKIKNLIIIE